MQSLSRFCHSRPDGRQKRLSVVRRGVQSWLDDDASENLESYLERSGVNRHRQYRGRGCDIGYSADITFRRDRHRSRSML